MRTWFLCLFSSALASAALAETPRSEMPPIDGEATTYVDEKGCVFVRVTVQGWTLWVQQVRDGTTGCTPRPTGEMI